jgi:hypothetical protein
MKHLEDHLQENCVKWFDLQHPMYILHHSPNGGRRTKFEGALFKRLGCRAGFPDLILLFGNDDYNGLLIELKTDKGVQSKSQKAFEKKVKLTKYKYVICRSLTEFITEITNYINNKK